MAANQSSVFGKPLFLPALLAAILLSAAIACTGRDDAAVPAFPATDMPAQNPERVSATPLPTYTLYPTYTPYPEPTPVVVEVIRDVPRDVITDRRGVRVVTPAPTPTRPPDRCVANDRDILTSLYQATGGPNWADNAHWLTDKPLAEWAGVSVDNRGCVIELDLSDNNLIGTIPPELNGLTNLKYLYLSFNHLTGYIPPELGNFDHLEDLYLSFNNLIGPIPPEIGDLPRLDYLELGGNQLAGRIPETLGNLSNLQYMHLADNNLSGIIPAELGRLHNLKWLDIHSNRLTGEIPPSLAELSKLYVFNFSNNAGVCAAEDPVIDLLREVETVAGESCADAERSILVDFYNSTGGPHWRNNDEWLTDAPLYDWYGIITDGSGRVTGLVLEDNNLVGSIPPSFGGLLRLEHVGLIRNHLKGEIPQELGNLSNLSSLSLGGNDLTGEIPPELGNLSGLISLLLSDNNLTGTLPTELGQLSNLQSFQLSQNRLTGELPDTLTAISGLRWFTFDRNDGLCAPLNLTDWLQGIEDYSQGPGCP